METIRFTATSVNVYQTTRNHIPEASTFHSQRHENIKLLLLLLLFILTANRFSPVVSGTTIRHNTEITHITQNNAMIRRNTAHNTLILGIKI
jgi:hypothetical protein